MNTTRHLSLAKNRHQADDASMAMKAKLRCLAFGLLLLSSPVATHAADDESENSFGSKTASSGTLIGILYDFKQNQRQEQVPGGSRLYIDTLDAFFAKGLDEGVLNQFFRATRALYANRIWIPRMPADKAPEAFAVGHVVEPRLWVVHYKGQLRATEAGTYRFWGTSDDVLTVAVNSEVVLNANHPNTPLKTLNWKGPSEFEPVWNKKMKPGTWFDLAEGEIIDIDILVGERPGGGFLAYLAYEKRGETYPVDKHNRKRLPIFRTSPEAKNENNDPDPPWIAIP